MGRRSAAPASDADPPLDAKGIPEAQDAADAAPDADAGEAGPGADLGAEAPGTDGAAVAADTTPSLQYTLKEQRRLEPCENLGKHDIFVRVVDTAGNGVNGLWVLLAPSNNAGKVLDKKQTQDKHDWAMKLQQGRIDFPMWKGATYQVYISHDGATPASTAFAKGLHTAFTDEASCPTGNGGNTLYHNSFSVIFVKHY